MPYTLFDSLRSWENVWKVGKVFKMGETFDVENYNDWILVQSAPILKWKRMYNWISVWRKRSPRTFLETDYWSKMAKELKVGGPDDQGFAQCWIFEQFLHENYQFLKILSFLWTMLKLGFNSQVIIGWKFEGLTLSG